jgi:uncharacterized protein
MTAAPPDKAIAPEFRPFFESLTRGRVSFPGCVTCGKFHWYPMYSCPHCGSDKIEWREIDGSASLYSWTTVHYPFPADPPKVLPYIVGLLEFNDAPGVRLITNLIDARPEQLFEDMPLVPVISQSHPPTVAFRPQPIEAGVDRALSQA